VGGIVRGKMSEGEYVRGGEISGSLSTHSRRVASTSRGRSAHDWYSANIQPESCPFSTAWSASLRSFVKRKIHYTRFPVTSP